MSMYQRQENLNLSIPEKILVIGVGGIGSWVTLNLALIGTKQIYVVDPDYIEIHNLNRTPYTLIHVGLEKVYAIQDLIQERRDDTIVYTYPNTLNEIIGHLKEIEFDYIIDCRDKINDETIKELNLLKAKYGKVKLGYDGKQITIHFNPKTVPWGNETGGYRVVPSYLVPPQILANILTEIIVSESFPKNETIKTFNVETLIKQLIKEK